MRTSQAKESEQYNMVESSHRDLEKKLKEKEWELADVTSMKDARYIRMYMYINHFCATGIQYFIYQR